MKWILCLPLISSLMLTSCSNQHIITGEPLVYGIAPDKGQVLDRDTPDISNPNLVMPHKGEIITLVLNTAFIKYLKAATSPHILVYTQIFDDGTDNADTAVTKVLYNERNSPAGVNLGLADRVLYGPTPFKGFPLRIKLFIVELDKEQKQLASKIIDAAGTTATTAKPEAAPAVAVAVTIAQAINAMNEDDFELRFDLTLYPVGTIGRAITGDKRLDGGDAPEPSQRHNKAVTMVSPLRTGSYAIMKRELEDRFSTWMGAPLTEASVFDMDYSQESFTSDYVCSDGQACLVDEVLRYEGGYFYRIVTGINKSGTDVERATVRPRTGPNRTVDVSLTRGIRQRFTDRTYVVLSVVTGLPLGLEPEALRAASERDARQLTKLLDNPSDASLSERIGPKVDALAASLKSLLEQRRVATEATRRVGRDPSFRISPEYALFWVQQIDPLTGEPGTVERLNAEARNAAILEALAEIVVNLPILSATDRTKMVALRTLVPADLEMVDGTPGIFRLNEQGKTKLH